MTTIKVRLRSSTIPGKKSSLFFSLVHRKKNKKILNGKYFSAGTLNCLSILAACLLEQLGWKCEEQVASLQFRIEGSRLHEVKAGIS